MKQYDIDHFIKKFEAIPEENWCVGHIYRNVNGNEQKCALGHCLTLENGHVVGYPEESLNLSRIVRKYKSDIVDINNGRDSRYTQDSPKKRVLAFFNEIKYEKEINSAVKEVQEIVNTEVLELV